MHILLCIFYSLMEGGKEIIKLTDISTRNKIDYLANKEDI